jgi:hypothetical protein
MEHNSQYTSSSVLRVFELIKQKQFFFLLSSHNLGTVELIVKELI